MARVAHRQTPNRSRELRERVWAAVGRRLAGHVICGKCGCTFSDYDDKCTAALDERCPGFNAIDAAFTAARREVGLA